MCLKQNLFVRLITKIISEIKLTKNKKNHARPGNHLKKLEKIRWLGGYSEGKIHDPIPNSTVKTLCGNDTPS